LKIYDSFEAKKEVFEDLDEEFEELEEGFEVNVMPVGRHPSL